MTTNKPMTGEQLDELMSAAVRMQRDAEVDRNFHSANFAYAVQVAVLELREFQRNKGISDLDFERACPDYMVCDLCGHDAHHCGGGNYECQEGHLFSVSERLFGSRVVPAGWVAVPANPTGDMLARIRLSDTWTTEALTARYKDMLRAAPRAPYVSFADQLRLDANTAELVAAGIITRIEE